MSDKEIKSNSLDKAVLCYGHFNVIHPGHIRYLDYARELGKKLCVVIQPDKDLLSDSADYLFSAEERALNLASLQVVDYVVMLDSLSLSEVINIVKPSNLVLGREFEYSKSIELVDAAAALSAIGGAIVFHGGDVHYSHSFLNSTLPLHEDKKITYLRACQRQGINKVDLLDRIAAFERSSLLIIGDTIIDQYVACEGIGMSAEAPVVVMRELEEDSFLGGAGIVAAHARSLGSRCHYLSVTGSDEKSELAKRFLEEFDVPYTLLHDPSRPTTFKIRYLVEKQKMFRVSRLKEHNLSRAIETRLIENIEKLSTDIKGILVCDFLYGVITEDVLAAIREIATRRKIPLYCDLQCSSQVGSILKFKNSNLICPTEREARIALGAKDDGLEWVANKVLETTGSKNLIMKLGSDGFIAYERKNDKFINRQPFPALSENPVDVTGAGDSLLAALAVGMSSGASLMESSAIAVCMAAAAVETIGNQPVNLNELRDRIKDFYQ